MVESMQQSSATPKNRDVGRGLQKIVACSHPYLAVASCIYSFWHGVIPTSYDFYTCFTHFFPHREHLHNIEGCPVYIALRLPGYPEIDIRISLALYSRALDISAKIRMREIQLVNSRNFRISQSRLLKGTNCLFASKDHVRPVSKRLCILFMACSCPISVLGRLI